MFTKLRALATPTTALRRLSYKRVNPTAPEYNETIQRGHERDRDQKARLRRLLDLKEIQELERIFSEQGSRPLTPSMRRALLQWKTPPKK
ncbi:Uncharacterized protein PBTT_04840 [Plasmodiophora brassicae]